ncbi:hypothetical protein L6452_03692 [Arctium lappa]|uniref:Uncharacterized protein n=1 Tax=Arctium lappa TaxID=4217 RepID=A0ACB9FNF7_ARCLA|nr:hypothetical protein L6452_03692 [Arctium lappa]
MLKKKLGCVENSEMAKLMLLNKFSTASSKLVLLEEINTAEHENQPQGIVPNSRKVEFVLKEPVLQD